MERYGRDSRAADLTLLAALLSALLLGLAACGTGAGSSPGTSSVAASPTFEMPGETAEDTSPPSLDPSLPGQSEVDGWGSIWDALPPSYPMFKGATEADAGSGPVSAAYTVANVDAPAREIAQFYLDALDEAGFGTGLDGPLEDGSYTVWSDSGYGCTSLVTVLPRGDENLVTVLYGAGCPFE
jgi:hypothetical protein